MSWQWVPSDTGESAGSPSIAKIAASAVIQLGTGSETFDLFVNDQKYDIRAKQEGEKRKWTITDDKGTTVIHVGFVQLDSTVTWDQSKWMVVFDMEPETADTTNSVVIDPKNLEEFKNVPDGLLTRVVSSMSSVLSIAANVFSIQNPPVQPLEESDTQSETSTQMIDDMDKTQILPDPATLQTLTLDVIPEATEQTVAIVQTDPSSDMLLAFKTVFELEHGYGQTTDPLLLVNLYFVLPDGINIEPFFNQIDTSTEPIPGSKKMRGRIKDVGVIDNYPSWRKLTHRKNGAGLFLGFGYPSTVYDKDMRRFCSSQGCTYKSYKWRDGKFVLDATKPIKATDTIRRPAGRQGR